jgi:hypothetical protein
VNTVHISEKNQEIEIVLKFLTVFRNGAKKISLNCRAVLVGGRMSGWMDIKPGLRDCLASPKKAKKLKMFLGRGRRS